MSQPNQFKGIPTEDLIEGLFTHTITPGIAGRLDLTTVPTFIKEFDLQPGDNLIKKGLLYLLYEYVTKEPADKYAFLKQMDSFFQSKRDFFLVNHNIDWALNMVSIINSKKGKITINDYKVFNNFINNYRIIRHSTWISLDFMYVLGMIYARAHKRKRISRKNMCILLKKTFKWKVDWGKQIWFQTNDVINRLNNDEKQLMIYKLTNVQENNKTKNKKRAQEIRRIKQACKFKVTEPPYRF